MQEPLGGVLGIIVALVFETVLFIARSSMKAGGGQKYQRYLDPDKFEHMQAGSTPAEGQQFITHVRLQAGTEHREPKKTR